MHVRVQVCVSTYVLLYPSHYSAEQMSAHNWLQNKNIENTSLVSTWTRKWGLFECGWGPLSAANETAALMTISSEDQHQFCPNMNAYQQMLPKIIVSPLSDHSFSNKIQPVNYRRRSNWWSTNELERGWKQNIIAAFYCNWTDCRE